MTHKVEKGRHGGATTPSAQAFGSHKRRPKYHIGSGTLTIVPEHGKLSNLHLSASGQPRIIKPIASNTPPPASDSLGKTTVVAQHHLTASSNRSDATPLPRNKAAPKEKEIFTIRSLNAHFKAKGCEKEPPHKTWDLMTTSLTLDALALDPSEIETFPDFPRIERLSLFKCAISDAQFAALIKRIGGTLKEVSIDFCFELTPQALIVLPPLVKIELGAHPPITDEFLAFLDPSAETLQHFSCSGTALSDKGIVILAAQCKNLITVDLSNSNITDLGFSALMSLPLLNSVTITGCLIGQEQINEFYRRLPGARIFRSFEMCPRPPDIELVLANPAEPPLADQQQPANDDIPDEVEQLIAAVEAGLKAPSGTWSPQRILTYEERRRRAQQYLRDNGFLDNDPPEESKASGALVIASQGGVSKREEVDDPVPLNGRTHPPLLLTGSAGSNSGPIVTEVDNDDDFYAPTLTLAPAYQAPEDFLRDSSFNIGVYHPDPSEKSSAPKPSLHKAHTIGPGGRSSHPSIATLVASAPFEKAPALLLCDNQTDPVPDTPAVVSVAALQHLPLVYAFVRAKGLAPQSGHPVDSILHDVRTQLEIRNSAVRAQNLEAIAATGSSKIRAADTAVIDLEDVTTWDEAEKALRASESVVNLRRMRPVLAQLWPVWMAQYKRFCGKVPDQYVHFKDFAAIPDDALDSAVRWISHEPLVFTGTKEIRFESLPEKLTMIPLCIAELPLTDLEVISFDDNEIRAFPPSCFAKSPKLKWFSIMDNRLTGSIPDTLTEPWREIEVLHFSRNQLTHLPRNLGRGCPRLKTVLFSFNRIAQIPPPLAAVIESLIPLKLKLFDVSHNCLTRDPSLAKLKQVLKTPDSERLPEL